jgi:hypothetical protein
MRVHRSIQILTILTTITAITACSSPGEAATAQPDAAPAAAEPAPPVAAAPSPVTVAINARWDSGPLDRAYQSERNDLNARHAREIARPSAGETVKVRVQRQANENQALELRYTQGKNSHARTLPPAER